MDANDRDRRDAAGVGPYARERERLVSLNSLGDWRTSDGEPDIRGWEIRTVSGRQLGTVADLLVDRDAGEAVMLDVDLPGSDRHTFVPLRVAQIDRALRVVLLDSADLQEGVDDDSPVSFTPVVASPPEVVASQPEVVVDRQPVVDEAAARRRQALRGSDPRDDTGFHAAGATERRTVDQRRRIDRMGTDL